MTEFVGTIVDRLGTRPAPREVDAVTKLPMSETVEDVRVLLGIAGYYRESRGNSLRSATNSECMAAIWAVGRF